MYSVTPSRRASAFSVGDSAAGKHLEVGARRVRLHARPRPVGGQRQHRRQAAQLLLPVGQVLVERAAGQHLLRCQCT